MIFGPFLPSMMFEAIVFQFYAFEEGAAVHPRDIPITLGCSNHGVRFTLGSMLTNENRPHLPVPGRVLLDADPLEFRPDVHVHLWPWSA